MCFLFFGTVRFLLAIRAEGRARLGTPYSFPFVFREKTRLFVPWALSRPVRFIGGDSRRYPSESCRKVAKETENELALDREFIRNPLLRSGILGKNPSGPIDMLRYPSGPILVIPVAFVYPSGPVKSMPHLDRCGFTVFSQSISGVCRLSGLGSLDHYGFP